MTERCQIGVVVVVAVLAATVSVRADVMPVSRPDVGCRQLPCACDATYTQPANCSSSFVRWSDTYAGGRLLRRYAPRNDINRHRTSLRTQGGSLTGVRLLKCGSRLSLCLCLCGLIGLGLFQSVLWAKKLSFDLVPDWRRSAAFGRDPNHHSRKKRKKAKKGTSGACWRHRHFCVFFRFVRLFGSSFFRPFLSEKQDVAPLPCGASPFPIGHRQVLGRDLGSAPACWFIPPNCTAAECHPQYYRGTIASLVRESQFSSTVLTSRGPP